MQDAGVCILSHIDGLAIRAKFPLALGVFVTLAEAKLTPSQAWSLDLVQKSVLKRF